MTAMRCERQCAARVDGAAYCSCGCATATRRQFVLARRQLAAHSSTAHWHAQHARLRTAGLGDEARPGGGRPRAN